MEQDARLLPEGACLEAEVCIVGSGPTGMTLATACAERGISVLLLESGGTKRESWAQELNVGLQSGDPHGGLQISRHRGVGGTTHIWNSPAIGGLGAKYLPLDRDDFHAPHGSGVDGWPFGFEELEPYYRAAQRVCGLGPFHFDAASWVEPGIVPITLPGQQFFEGVYQYGPGSRFTQEYPALLREAPLVQVCHHGTASELVTDAARQRVAEIRVRSPAGGQWAARAKVFVLAAGAIENARLLLVSTSAGEPPLGGESGWVGRCFMEHPRDSTLTLVPGSSAFYRRAEFYDIRTARDGTVIAGRIGLSGETRRGLGLGNASISLIPARRHQSHGGLLGHLRMKLAQLRRLQASDQVGWSRRADAGRVFEGLRIYMNLEQRPHPENRLTLSQHRDALGVPRIALEWRWRANEQLGLERLRRLVRDAFSGRGLGVVREGAGGPPDPNSHHHAGTTRMSRDRRGGVVDEAGRVFDTENLYAVGSSVFPTAGFANPTLTCVALGLRLAAHLDGVLSRRRTASSS